MNFFSKYFRDSFTGYQVLVLLSFIIYFFSMPIKMGDTDMWYHLNGGRYFWEHMTIPNTSFFSFIDPPREWINYFWGFQALIFKIYENVDYFGLLLLRALLSSATLIMVFFTSNQINSLKIIFLSF